MRKEKSRSLFINNSKSLMKRNVSVSRDQPKSVDQVRYPRLKYKPKVPLSTELLNLKGRSQVDYVKQNLDPKNNIFLQKSKTSK